MRRQLFVSLDELVELTVPFKWKHYEIHDEKIVVKFRRDGLDHFVELPHTLEVEETLEGADFIQSRDRP